MTNFGILTAATLVSTAVAIAPSIAQQSQGRGTGAAPGGAVSTPNTGAGVAAQGGAGVRGGNFSGGTNFQSSSRQTPRKSQSIQETWLGMSKTGPGVASTFAP